jgi:hypothetical protein
MLYVLEANSSVRRSEYPPFLNSKESNMRVLSVSWHPDKDVTKLKFNDEFLSSDWTVRADVLKDILEEISEMYEQMLTKSED